MNGIGKRVVYVLRSDQDPSRHDVGVTEDVERRLEWHNAGPSGQTVRPRPWSMIVVIEFADEHTAVDFQKATSRSMSQTLASPPIAYGVT